MASSLSFSAISSTSDGRTEASEESAPPTMRLVSSLPGLLRPAKAKARFGSLVERFLGANNTQFVHNLQGNTQIMRNVRQVTKSVNPKCLATWPLAELYDRLCEYLYEVYDTADHPALGQSPREAFLSRLSDTGERQHRMIPYDEEFLIFTLPTTAKGSARVTPGNGVKIHHVYYWCEAFRDPKIQGQQVAIRYDPFDVGAAYAFVHKQWVPCHSEHYAVLKGRSEREIKLATEELRQRHRNHSTKFIVTARRLAEFLQSVEAEESLLIQRKCDLESRVIRQVVAGGLDGENHPLFPGESHVATAETVTIEEPAVDEVYGVF